MSCSSSSSWSETFTFKSPCISSSADSVLLRMLSRVHVETQARSAHTCRPCWNQNGLFSGTPRRPIWRHVQQELRLRARPRQRRGAASNAGTYAFRCCSVRPNQFGGMLFWTSLISVSQLRSGQTRTKAMHGALVLLPDFFERWGYNLLLRAVSPTVPLMAMLHARTTSHVPAAPRQFMFSTGFPRVIGSRPKRRRRRHTTRA